MRITLVVLMLCACGQAAPTLDATLGPVRLEPCGSPAGPSPCSFREALFVTAPANSSLIGVGDVTGEGVADLVFSNRAQLFTLAGHGGGTFAPPVAGPARPGTNYDTLVDVDGDGRSEVFTISREGEQGELRSATISWLENGTWMSGPAPHGIGHPVRADDDAALDWMTLDETLGGTTLSIYRASDGALAPPAWSFDLTGRRCLPIGGHLGVGCDDGVITLIDFAGGAFSARQTRPFTRAKLVDPAIVAADLDGDDTLDFAAQGFLSSVVDVVIGGRASSIESSAFSLRLTHLEGRNALALAESRAGHAAITLVAAEGARWQLVSDTSTPRGSATADLNGDGIAELLLSTTAGVTILSRAATY